MIKLQVMMDKVRFLFENNTKSILGKAGLEVQKFVQSGGNSEEAISLLGSGGVSRVLGTCWNPSSDKFPVNVKSMYQEI